MHRQSSISEGVRRENGLGSILGSKRSTADVNYASADPCSPMEIHERRHLAEVRPDALSDIVDSESADAVDAADLSLDYSMQRCKVGRARKPLPRSLESFFGQFEQGFRDQGIDADGACR